MTLVAFAGPMRADVITGMFDGVATLTPTAEPGVFTQNFTGDGNDTILGAFTPSSQSTIDFSKPPNILVSDGTFLETFTDGTLFGTTSGEGTASGTGTATFTADIVFTGGTGIFAGDTGEASVTGTLTRTNPTTLAVNTSYTGVLVPEPSAWVLLATVFFGFGLRQLRKI
jgi:PEP-CTERM motif